MENPLFQVIADLSTAVAAASAENPLRPIGDAPACPSVRVRSKS